MASSQQEDARYEEQHVHQVYNQIASHFSSTRFKPWPVVDEFLRSLPSGSIGLDVGCGNGKYLTVNRDVFIAASDRSPELLSFARQHQPHSAVVADTLNLPHPNGSFDFAISIAVIHHLSTTERRREALACLLRTLVSSDSAVASTLSESHGAKNNGRNTRRRAGQALIFVWALEQKNSRRGWDVGDSQDVLVPWVLKSDTGTAGASESADLQSNQHQSKTYQRYYHLYRSGELEDDIRAVGGKVVRNGYDRDNWWAVCER